MKGGGEESEVERLKSKLKRQLNKAERMESTLQGERASIQAERDRLKEKEEMMDKEREEMRVMKGDLQAMMDRSAEAERKYLQEIDKAREEEKFRLASIRAEIKREEERLEGLRKKREGEETDIDGKKIDNKRIPDDSRKERREDEDMDAYLEKLNRGDPLTEEGEIEQLKNEVLQLHKDILNRDIRIRELEEKLNDNEYKDY